ncbi:CDPK-related protein kinase [Hibiscus syriacus]|uniref:non-specific serine/threonine protein kinase n=1 Tax=Hibiscus syriacus TaxID=106335 RepID=A0A6A3D2F2_HIBSY|nr:CDPK-related protein kinase [Hibiscus syriacus]
MAQKAASEIFGNKRIEHDLRSENCDMVLRQNNNKNVTPGIFQNHSYPENETSDKLIQQHLDFREYREREVKVTSAGLDCNGCTSNPNQYSSRDHHRNDYPAPPKPPKSPLPPLPPTTPFLPLYTPSPAHPNRTKTPSTPLRFLRRSFPPPSPAKHIRAVLRRRKSNNKEVENGTGIAESTAEAGEEEGVELDKRFGFSKELRSRLEVGEEVGRGHFGYTCSAKFKKGEFKGQHVAVKDIPKSKCIEPLHGGRCIVPFIHVIQFIPNIRLLMNRVVFKFEIIHKTFAAGQDVTIYEMTTAIAVEDVRREVKILRTLTGHINLVKFYDAFEDHDNVYIVMELCEGGELLDRILARGGKYTEDDAKAVMVQILNVVAFCHLQGVVHRDLKPENFLYITKEEKSLLKAIDFGLSDFVRPDERLNDIVGSAYYVAPEVLHRSYGTEADVWKAKDFVKRLLIKDPRKGMTAAQALSVCITFLCNIRLMKAYMRSSPLWKAALKALSKTLTPDELFYMREQFALLEPKHDSITLENIKTALMKNATDAMEFHIPDFVLSLNALQYRRMDFEEFCAAALSVHQIEAFDHWEQHARCAYELFEKDGNRAVVIEELASVSFGILSKH